MDCSMPGFLFYLLECAQTHVHWVSDAIQPSPPSPALNFSQRQSLFQWVGSSYQRGGQSIGLSASASVLPMNIQGWFPLGWTSLISLLFKGLYPVFFFFFVCVCVCECPSPHSSSVLPQGVGGLPDHRYGSSWVPSQLRNSYLEGQSCWWLWQSCLLIQQEILHFSGKGGSSEEVRCGRKN